MSRVEENTEKILKASIEEFVSHGVKAATMEGIANKASVSKRTLYKYFTNKQKILDTIIHVHLDSVLFSSDYQYSQSVSISEQLDGIIQQRIDLMTSKEFIKISKLVITELLQSNPLKQEHIEKYTSTETHFIAWIEAAKKDGKVNTETPSQLIANQMSSIINGQVFYPVILGFVTLTKEEIATAKSTCKDFFLRMFCSVSK